MSKSNKKKVVVTTNNDSSIKATVSRKSVENQNNFQSSTTEMMFNKVNYLWLIGGVLLIIIGLALMSGGKMTSPDVWDENIIYSSRRLVLAPFTMLAGLIVAGIGIFKK